MSQQEKERRSKCEADAERRRNMTPEAKAKRAKQKAEWEKKLTPEAKAKRAKRRKQQEKERCSTPEYKAKRAKYDKGRKQQEKERRSTPEYKAKRAKYDKERKAKKLGLELDDLPSLNIPALVAQHGPEILNTLPPLHRQKFRLHEKFSPLAETEEALDYNAATRKFDDAIARDQELSEALSNGAAFKITMGKSYRFDLETNISNPKGLPAVLGNEPFTESERGFVQDRFQPMIMDDLTLQYRRPLPSEVRRDWIRKRICFTTIPENVKTCDRAFIREAKDRYQGSLNIQGGGGGKITSHNYGCIVGWEIWIVYSPRSGLPDGWAFPDLVSDTTGLTPFDFSYVGERAAV